MSDVKPRRGRRWLIVGLILLAVVLVPVACVKTLDARARTKLSQFVAQSHQELAFIGGVASTACVLADAVEATQTMTPVTKDLQATADKPPTAENVRGVLNAYANASRLVVRKPPAPPGDTGLAARSTAVALADRVLPLLNGLPAYDDDSRTTKASVIALAQDWKRIAPQQTYDPASVRQLDADLRKAGNDAEKVFRHTFADKLKGTDVLVIPIYAFAISSRLPVISKAGMSMMSALISSTNLDEALRSAPTFDAARTSGCLSEKPALFDAFVAFEVREMGPDFIDKLSQGDKHD